MRIPFDSADDMIKFLHAMGYQLTPEQERELRDPFGNHTICTSDLTRRQSHHVSHAPNKGKENELLLDNQLGNHEKQKLPIAQNADKIASSITSRETNLQPRSGQEEQPRLTAPSPFSNSYRPSMRP